MLLVPAEPGALDRVALEYRDDVEHEDVANVEADGDVYKPPNLAAGEHAQVEAENGYLGHPNRGEVEQFIPEVNLRCIRIVPRTDGSTYVENMSDLVKWHRPHIKAQPIVGH